jgi:DMSO reductase iron-sulfur subunit
VGKKNIMTIKQKSFIFDLNKCTGCGACVLACAIENEVELHNSWRSIYTYNEFNFPDVPKYHFSLACNHCVDPPCLKSCPALAYQKDEKTGVVLLDKDKCIGCKYCSWICPYDAPKFNQNQGVMEKCTFCEHRLKEGFDPACVALCPTTALQFGDYIENNSAENIPGFTTSTIKPAIKFIHKNSTPESSLQAEIKKEDILNSFETPKPKIDLAKEWTLVAFTLLAAFLVGWYSTLIFNHKINYFLFFAIGTTALLVSTFHLGKIFRSYRAILNIKNSWLSREILFFTLFLSLAFVCEYFFNSNLFLKWLIIFLGLASLISIDRVYQILPGKTVAFHSANVLLTGILFFSFFIDRKEIFIAVIFIKMILYSIRIFPLLKKQLANPFISMSRWIIGFFFVLLFETSDLPNLQIIGFICLLIGEIIDRCEFYLELKIPTPQWQINEDLLQEIQK